MATGIPANIAGNCGVANPAGSRRVWRTPFALRKDSRHTEVVSHLLLESNEVMPHAASHETVSAPIPARQPRAIEPKPRPIPSAFVAIALVFVTLATARIATKRPWVDEAWFT